MINRDGSTGAMLHWLRLTSFRDRSNLGSTHIQTELLYSTESKDVGAWHFTMEDVLGPS